MADTTRRHLMRVLKPFKRQQSELLGTILRHGGRLHQADFDEEFSGFYIDNGRRYRCAPQFGFSSFLFGPLTQEGDWAKFLELLQGMVFFGRVRLEGQLPDVYYCI